MFSFKSRKGFSLTELLIVIGILAVLAAIAIPSVAGIIDRANQSSDNTNANEMTNAIERFTSEYELYKQDVASGKVTFGDFDSMQGRVFDVTGIYDRVGIEGVENIGYTNYVTGIDLDTKYPVNEVTAKKVITNYIKTSSATFTPKQSDYSYYYSPQIGVVVPAPTGSTASQIDEIAKANGVDYATVNNGEMIEWINLTINEGKPQEDWTYVNFATETEDVYMGYRLCAPCFDIEWTTEDENGNPVHGVSHKISIKNSYFEGECNTPATMNSVPAGNYALVITDEKGWYYEFNFSVYREGVQKFVLETPSGKITLGTNTDTLQEAVTSPGTQYSPSDEIGPSEEVDGTTFVFIVNNETMYANSGMTFAEWLNSPHNTKPYSASAEIKLADYTPVDKSTVIQSGGQYIINEFTTTQNSMSISYTNADDAEIKTITFEEGMTWGEWVHSYYNTIGLKLYREDASYTSENEQYADAIMTTHDGQVLVLSSQNQCCDAALCRADDTMPASGSTYYLLPPAKQK